MSRSTARPRLPCPSSLSRRTAESGEQHDRIDISPSETFSHLDEVVYENATRLLTVEAAPTTLPGAGFDDVTGERKMGRGTIRESC